MGWFAPMGFTRQGTGLLLCRDGLKASPNISLMQTALRLPRRAL